MLSQNQIPHRGPFFCELHPQFRGFSYFFSFSDISQTTQNEKKSFDGGDGILRLWHACLGPILLRMPKGCSASNSTSNRTSKIIFAVLNLAFSDAPFTNSFHQDVKPGHYRLFQVADFVSTVRLLEAKRENHSITDFEREFIDDWHFKNVYLRTLNRKELR